jgi:hypothetical protein
MIDLIPHSMQPSISPLSGKFDILSLLPNHHPTSFTHADRIMGQPSHAFPKYVSMIDPVTQVLCLGSDTNSHEYQTDFLVDTLIERERKSTSNKFHNIWVQICYDASFNKAYPQDDKSTLGSLCCTILYHILSSLYSITSIRLILLTPFPPLSP